VLINVTAAQAFFRNVDEAVGKHIQLGMQGHEVIGVVGSVRQAGLGRPPGPEVYSLMGADESTGILTIAIRTRQRPDRATIQSIAAVVQHYDNTQTRPALIPLDTFLSDTISARRTAARLGLAFAFVSLGLAEASMGLFPIPSRNARPNSAFALRSGRVEGTSFGS